MAHGYGQGGGVLDLVCTGAPEDNPVTLARAKQHLQLFDDDTDRDGLIADLITAATQSLDGYAGILGRALVEQSWTLSLDYGFPIGMSADHRRINLPLPPLISVEAIRYVDLNGATQTLDPASYVVLAGPIAGVIPAPLYAWPATVRRPRAVMIDFTCGYGAVDAVPKPICSAILLMVGDLYANREGLAVAAMGANLVNPTVKALLAPYRVGRI